MITPQEARAIWVGNHGEVVQSLIELTEEEIREQAKKGRRMARLAYTDNPYAKEAVSYFERLGFDVEVVSEAIGGVRQYPAYFVRW